MYYRKRKPENTIKTNFSQKSSIVNVAKACSSVRREGGQTKDVNHRETETRNQFSGEHCFPDRQREKSSQGHAPGVTWGV